MKPTVIFGFLGSKRDIGETQARWDTWRPTVALGMYKNLKVDRIEIFYEPNDKKLLKQVIADLNQVSPQTLVVPNVMGFKDPWDFEEVYAKMFDFLKAYPFDQEAEEYFIHIKTGTHALQICYFLLTEAGFFPGKLLQSFPPRADRPEEKAVGSYKIIDLDLSKYQQLMSRFEQERTEATTFLKSGIETRSKKFNELIDRIELVALRAKEPILLTGGTGVGKSQLARKIYELKKQQGRISGKFVAINAATLRVDHAMSTLFGHRKGAFTGAVSDRPGLLLEANKGLFFLDEIGELGLDEQAMLLKAVEEKRFLPVGSDTESESDFQLIAATNRDLHDAVREGKFREDLLARINLWTFRLPELLERKEDIEPNIEYELLQYTIRNERKITFGKEARKRFLDFAVGPEGIWKANFRDLNAAITRMATLSEGNRIQLEIVETEIERLKSQWRQPSTDLSNEKVLLEILGEERFSQLDSFDAVQLAHVVKVCRESKSLAEAGRRLFQYSRTKKKSQNDTDRVSKYLAAFGLSWDEVTNT